jgi:hypothetical protein
MLLLLLDDTLSDSVDDGEGNGDGHEHCDREVQSRH